MLRTDITRHTRFYNSSPGGAAMTAGAKSAGNSAMNYGGGPGLGKIKNSCRWTTEKETAYQGIKPQDFPDYKNPGDEPLPGNIKPPAPETPADMNILTPDPSVVGGMTQLLPASYKANNLTGDYEIDTILAREQKARSGQYAILNPDDLWGV